MPAANASAKTPSAPRLRHALRSLGRSLSKTFLTPRRRAARLDPRMLSDHLKRDLGLLDGNDPAGPHR
ncbi:MAG TPA: hypothetical protein VGN97_17970 [Mesorhizobium sp.]|jgi:hypothetical protein|nr:hypothetical protein [Mesorhizobium sp.]